MLDKLSSIIIKRRFCNSAIRVSNQRILSIVNLKLELCSMYTCSTIFVFSVSIIFFLYFVSFDSFIQALPNSPNTYTFHTSGDIAFHACLSLITKAFCSIDLSVESLVLLPFLFPTPTLVLHEKINRTGLNYMDNSDRYTSLLGFSEF